MFIRLLYLSLLLLTTILGIVRHKKLTVPFRLLTAIIGITFIVESINWQLSIHYHDARFLAHIMSLAELNFYFPIFYLLFNQKVTKNIILGLIIFFNIFSFINSFFLQPYYNNFPSNVLLPVQICYAILSLVMFRQMLLNTLDINITKQSIFWYSSAMLFLSTSLFFFLGLNNYFVIHHLSFHFLSTFNYVINLIFYTMAGYSIYLNSKEHILNEG
jgi:hypothetical protein